MYWPVYDNLSTHVSPLLLRRNASVFIQMYNKGL